MAENELLDNYFSMFSKINELNQKMGPLACTYNNSARPTKSNNYANFLNQLNEINHILEELDNQFSQIANKYKRD